MNKRLFPGAKEIAVTKVLSWQARGPDFKPSAHTKKKKASGGKS